jgi:hypothetical protein
MEDLRTRLCGILVAWPFPIYQELRRWVRHLPGN